jgi:acyl carrier protein
MADGRAGCRDAGMTDDELAASLVDTMRTVFKQDDITFEPDRHLRDIFGLDSVQFVQLILAIETRFDMTLDEEEVDGIERIGDLFKLVRGKRA